MIDTSQVYKCLEKKTFVMGFELTDLFMLGLLLSTLNILFAHSSYKLFITWGPVFLLALIIRLTKNGKADNFLIHYIKYKISPGIYRAFPPAGTNQLFALKRKGISHVRLILEQKT